MAVFLFIYCRILKNNYNFCEEIEVFKFKNNAEIQFILGIVDEEKKVRSSYSASQKVVLFI